jgi:uncharacterized Rossmann fold enzyme
LRRLSEAGARLWPLYAIVEERLGFHRRRESTIASNKAWALDCNSACHAATLAEALVEEARGRVCVVGPLARGIPPYCGLVIAAGEDALEVVAGRAGKLGILVTDADGNPPLDPHTLDLVVFLHVHADNLHLASQRVARALWGRVILTSQVPLPGCVVSPFGFADGDRAILAAAALGAGEIRVVGIELEPANEKFRSSLAYIEAVARLWGFSIEREGAHAFTLRRLALNQPQGR